MNWLSRLLPLLILFSVLFSVSSDVKADEEDSLRIARPTFRMPQEMRFTEGREGLGLNHFALWTRNYLHPVICTSVMCGGSCAAYLDSCPSFTGLSVLDFSQNENFNLDGASLSGARCPVNVPRGLVASDGCGASACSADSESSAKDSCCSP